MSNNINNYNGINVWWHPSIQEFIDEIDLTNIMTNYLGIRRRDLLLRNWSNRSSSRSYELSYLLLPGTNSSITVDYIIDWLISTYPGPARLDINSDCN